MWASANSCTDRLSIRQSRKVTVAVTSWAAMVYLAASLACLQATYEGWSRRGHHYPQPLRFVPLDTARNGRALSIQRYNYLISAYTCNAHGHLTPREKLAKQQNQTHGAERGAGPALGVGARMLNIICNSTLDM